MTPMGSTAFAEQLSPYVLYVGAQQAPEGHPAREAYEDFAAALAAIRALPSTEEGQPWSA